jgi:hypothetical protein
LGGGGVKFDAISLSKHSKKKSLNNENFLSTHNNSVCTQCTL